MGIAFKVYVRCANCQKDYGCRLVPPEAEDAPVDIDELLESRFLQEQRFHCRECECPIGTVTGVKVLEDETLVAARTLEPCS
jgi:TPP-dependent indolepyruvate ferredoxin oxidoreductase alpha subunit